MDKISKSVSAPGMHAKNSRQGAIKPHIAIVGAGLLGRMLAVRLAQVGQVTLYEKDSVQAPQSAAYIAAAMLAPAAESAESEMGIVRAGELAVPLWQQFLSTLKTPVFFQQKGSLLLNFAADQAAMQGFVQRLKSTSFKPVKRAQIAQLEPEINPALKQGVFLPHEAQLDNRELLVALQYELDANPNVTWQTNTHVNLADNEARVKGKTIAFDYIFDCRGMGSQADFKAHLKANQSLLRGVRGEVVRLHAPKVTLHRPVRLMHPRYPLYIAPKANHHFVVGATQLESQDQRQPTVKSALELLSACFSVHKGFAEAEILSLEAGLRPAFKDHAPCIQQTGKVMRVNGLYRHGYLLAPIVVDYALQRFNQWLSSSQFTSLQVPMLSGERSAVKLDYDSLLPGLAEHNSVAT